MRARAVAAVRHVFLHAEEGESLLEAVAAALGAEGTRVAWLTAAGTLRDLELRGASPEAPARALPGPVETLSLTGHAHEHGGDLRLSFHGVFAWEGPQGLETAAGEIAAAHVVRLTAYATVSDEAARAEVEAPRRATWSDAMAASSTASSAASSAAASPPPRPVRRALPEDEDPTPEPGDIVEHFAFGRGDVLKGDGERLHVRIHKDGRVREIALSMLRVVALPADGGTRRYRLERKL